MKTKNVLIFERRKKAVEHLILHPSNTGSENWRRGWKKPLRPKTKRGRSGLAREPCRCHGPRGEPLMKFFSIQSLKIMQESSIF